MKQSDIDAYHRPRMVHLPRRRASQLTSMLDLDNVPGRIGRKKCTYERKQLFGRGIPTIEYAVFFISLVL
jgi:hypothetical protein